ncbi:YhcN/YlaJ family sporulation lipoprotein [Peribacillus glennii]|uniref:YhcN/YlaJ family sporulation lipoprotein n=1 Tax=Peribacillus glennii TaxID=2303991 RepID=UPI001F243152|nr:YhcN/YlaJ family sporulation lipoprotein [Peribacillus glennii]
MKKYWYAAIAFLFIAGCNSDNNAVENRDNHPQTSQVQNTAIRDIDKKNGKQVAGRLARLAEGVGHVNDATAVVLGNYAVVGIDVDANLERSEVGTVKYSVAQALSEDPAGANAVVVADADTNARIREMAQDIQNGRPIQGIMNELADITGRVIPDGPGDHFGPPQTNSLEDEKKEMGSQKERRIMERQQDKQSNHYKDKER